MVLAIKDVAWTAWNMTDVLTLLIIIRLTGVGCLKRLFDCGNNSFVTGSL